MNETLRMETTKRTLNVKPFPMDSVLKMIRAHYEKMMKNLISMRGKLKIFYAK